jgi:hypothetical protein
MNEVIEKLDKQGERAFPFVTPEFFAPGMTLRDYFAAKAMQNLIDVHREMFMDYTHDDWFDDAFPNIANEAYALADVMMKARDKK